MYLFKRTLVHIEESHMFYKADFSFETLKRMHSHLKAEMTHGCVGWGEVYVWPQIGFAGWIT